MNAVLRERLARILEADKTFLLPEGLQHHQEDREKLSDLLDRTWWLDMRTVPTHCGFVATWCKTAGRLAVLTGDDHGFEHLGRVFPFWLAELKWYIALRSRAALSGNNDQVVPVDIYSRDAAGLLCYSIATGRTEIGRMALRLLTWLFTFPRASYRSWWESRSFEFYAVRLYCLHTGAPLPAWARGKSAGVYEELLDSVVQDERAFKAAATRACNKHWSRATTVNGPACDLCLQIFSIVPIEVLAAQAARVGQNLPPVKISHALLKLPLSAVDRYPDVSDRLATRAEEVHDRMMCDYSPMAGPGGGAILSEVWKDGVTDLGPDGVKTFDGKRPDTPRGDTYGLSVFCVIDDRRPPELQFKRVVEAITMWFQKRGAECAYVGLQVLADEKLEKCVTDHTIGMLHGGILPQALLGVLDKVQLFLLDPMGHEYKYLATERQRP